MPEDVKIKTILRSEDFLPLDRRWQAVARVAGRRVWALGATAEDASEALAAKIAALKPEASDD